MKGLTITIPEYKLQMLAEAMAEAPISELLAELLKFTDNHYATLRNIQNGYGLTSRPETEDAKEVLDDLRANEPIDNSEICDWMHALKIISAILAATETIYDEVHSR